MIKRFLPEKGFYIIQTYIFLRYKKWKLHKRKPFSWCKKPFLPLQCTQRPYNFWKFIVHSTLIEEELNFKDVIHFTTNQMLTREGQHLSPHKTNHLLLNGLKFISLRFDKVWVKTNFKKDTVSISLHFNGFTYYLTLFSEYFSSFPHATCSPSVSC